MNLETSALTGWGKKEMDRNVEIETDTSAPKTQHVSPFNQKLWMVSDDFKQENMRKNLSCFRNIPSSK